MPREGVLGSRGQCVWGFIPSSTQALAEAGAQAEGRLGKGGQSFAKEEAGILVGNHSNEAMKPEPCLRTNWPDLA